MEDGQLMSEGEHLQFKRCPTPKPEGNQRSHCGQDRKHAGHDMAAGTKLQCLRSILNYEQPQVAGVPEELKRRFPIALELGPPDHVRMQAAFQKHVDAAVSKTVNLPTSASPHDVRQVFDAARSFKLKGITVYRYGSKSRQALSFVEDERIPDCRECAV